MDLIKNGLFSTDLDISDFHRLFVLTSFNFWYKDIAGMPGPQEKDCSFLSVWNLLHAS